MKPGDLVIIDSATVMWTRPYHTGQSRGATSNIVCRLEPGRCGVVLQPDTRVLWCKDDMCLFGDRYGYVPREHLKRLL